MSYTTNTLYNIFPPSDPDEQERWCIDRIREIDEEYRLRKEPYVKLWCDIKARRIHHEIEVTGRKWDLIEAEYLQSKNK